MRLADLSRAQIWTYAINGALGLGLLIVGWSLIVDGIHFMDSMSRIRDDLSNNPDPESGPVLQFGSDLWFMLWERNSPGTLGLVLDGWTIWLVRRCSQRGYTSDPMSWMPFTRLSLLMLALLTVIGLPMTRPFYEAGDELGGFFSLFKVVMTPVVLPLAGALTILGVVVIVAIPVGAVYFLINGLPMMVVDQVHEWVINRHVATKKKQRFFGQVSEFSLWLRGEPIPEAPPDDSKGARFATFQEIKKVFNIKSRAAFGQLNKQPVFLHTEKHVLIMASTRSGKGIALIVPHLLYYMGSAFVLDPKGENARATGRHREGVNDEVHYLDPFGISGKPKSRFNPLSRFNELNMEAESKALAAALVVVTGERRDHWTASAQQLLALMILYVYCAPGIDEDERDLVTVRRLLLSSVKVALKEMVESEKFREWNSEEMGDLFSDLAKSFLDTPEKEFGSILSAAQRETEILDNPQIAASLSAAGDGPEVDFEDWHTGTMTVYLCLSAPRFPVFNRWLRLVLTSALDEMTYTLQPPELPVCFMLDELATLGHLTIVENAIGLAAGYGVQIYSVFQDVAQMRDLYKGRWASFISNAGIRVLFNLDDYETAEYWSKFLGTHLVENVSESVDVYGLTKGGTSSEVMRPLLSPEEIMMQFAANKMLVLAQGSHPIITDRVPYYEDERLKGYWDDPRAPIAR